MAEIRSRLATHVCSLSKFSYADCGFVSRSER